MVRSNLKCSLRSLFKSFAEYDDIATEMDKMKAERKVEMEEISVNENKYRIIKLLGKGKGGYSYLVDDGARVAIVCHRFMLISYDIKGE